jgi:hypothetical protein
MHAAIWPLIKEMTAEQPRLVSGTLSYQQHDPNRQPPELENLNPGGLHCAREGRAWGTRYAVGNDQQGQQGGSRERRHGEGRIFCAPLVVFCYLTDVKPGDGGLIVVPGSHKSSFARPEILLEAGPDNIDPAPSQIITNLTPSAGDFLFCSENLTHGVLRWRPMDRSRRFLIFRYEPSFQSNASDPGNIPPTVVARLAKGDIVIWTKNDSNASKITMQVPKR